MKSLPRAMLFALLAAGCVAAHAQRHVLYAPLPRGVERPQALDVARQVLIARGWEATLTDRQTLEGHKGLSGIRISMQDGSLRYGDLTDRPQMRQRNREEGPKLAAIPQAEIDALRGDLAAAFAGKLPAPSGVAPGAPSAVLVDAIDPGLSPVSVMLVAQRAFAGRRWTVTPEGKEAFVARIRTVETDATLRVFVADGALRYADITNRYGEKRYTEKSRLPERWIVNLRADIGHALAALPKQEAARPATAGDPAERLRRLKAMFDSGLISQGEYDAKRAEILKAL